MIFSLIPFTNSNIATVLSYKYFTSTFDFFSRPNFYDKAPKSSVATEPLGAVSISNCVNPAIAIAKASVEEFAASSNP